MKNLLLLLPFLLACQVDSNAECAHVEQETYNELIWVCHNPESERHGLRCSEECFDEGDTSAFCWILETDECRQEHLNPHRLNAACEALDIQ